MECSSKTKGKFKAKGGDNLTINPKAKGEMYMFKSKFQIDEGPIYDGYTNGNHWNGWACPWFTKETADKIATEVNADAPYCTMHYDKANDAFIYKGYGEEEVGIFKGKDIQGKHLYPVGAYYWVWDDLSEM